VSYEAVFLPLARRSCVWCGSSSLPEMGRGRFSKKDMNPIKPNSCITTVLLALRLVKSRQCSMVMKYKEATIRFL
jgi:hypothetical protein